MSHRKEDIFFIKKLADILYSDYFVLICEENRFFFYDPGNMVNIEIETMKLNILNDIENLW